MTGLEIRFATDVQAACLEREVRECEYLPMESADVKTIPSLKLLIESTRTGQNQ